MAFNSEQYSKNQLTTKSAGLVVKNLDSLSSKPPGFEERRLLSTNFKYFNLRLHAGYSFVCILAVAVAAIFGPHNLNNLCSPDKNLFVGCFRAQEKVCMQYANKIS